MNMQRSTSKEVRDFLRDVIFRQKQYRSVLEFSVTSKLSQAYLSQILADNPEKIKNPSAEVLDKLAAAFHVETWEFLKMARDFAEKKTASVLFSTN